MKCSPWYLSIQAAMTQSDDRQTSPSFLACCENWKMCVILSWVSSSLDQSAAAFQTYVGPLNCQQVAHVNKIHVCPFFFQVKPSSFLLGTTPSDDGRWPYLELERIFIDFLCRGISITFFSSSISATWLQRLYS